MRTLLMLLLLMSANAFAEVSRNEAEKMIEEMVKTNMISKEEAEKAIVRMQAMTATEWSAVNQEAEVKARKLQHEASRGPASVAVGDPSSDIEKEQMSAIHNDLQTLSPHYNRP